MSEPLWRMIIRDPGCGWVSANGGGGWRRRAPKVKRWRQVAAQLARAGHVPRLQHAHIVILVHRAWATRRADANNLQPTAKAVVDGLVDAGLLVDDDDRRLQGPDMRPAPNVEQGRVPYLEVLVYPHPELERSQSGA